MIKLTRLGGEEFILNAELIRYVESRPDTWYVPKIFKNNKKDHFSASIGGVCPTFK
jgi:uncharacterized protein YlzI (FlbEa/FlbD family)